jgi:lipopolysaccharide export system permease protein
VTAIFVLFVGLIAYVEQLRQIGDKADATQVAILTLFNLPTDMYQIFPLITILAALWFFLSLARSSELVISRAADAQ